MLKNAYFLTKIGTDTADNQQFFGKIPTGRLSRRCSTTRMRSVSFTGYCSALFPMPPWRLSWARTRGGGHPRGRGTTLAPGRDHEELWGPNTSERALQSLFEGLAMLGLLIYRPALADWSVNCSASCCAS